MLRKSRRISGYQLKSTLEKEKKKNSWFKKNESGFLTSNHSALQLPPQGKHGMWLTLNRWGAAQLVTWQGGEVWQPPLSYSLSPTSTSAPNPQLRPETFPALPPAHTLKSQL